MWTYTLSIEIVLFTICILSGVIKSECPAEEDYAWTFSRKLPNGVENWKDNYPNCGGKEQSPIDIQKSDAETGSCEGFQLENYDKAITKVKILNNGTILSVTPKDDVERSVKVDDDTYKLKEFFIRGKSDHKFNGKEYALELQFLHETDEGKKVVISVLFQEGVANFPALKAIFNHTSSFTYAGDSYDGDIDQVTFKSGDDDVTKDPLVLEELVSNGSSYYRYSGSVPIPPCNEDVTWLVAEDILTVKENLVKQYHSIYMAKKDSEDLEKCKFVQNFRPTQELNDRKVTYCK